MEKLIQEKCGLVALLSKTYTSQQNIAIHAAAGVQHRGTHGAGIAYLTKSGIFRHMGDGLLWDIFTPTVIKKFKENTLWTIVHCRYGTNGDYDKNNLQPCLVSDPRLGSAVVAHNGQFTGAEKIASAMGIQFSKTESDTFLYSKILSKSKGETWREKVLASLDMVKGAYSLIVGVDGYLFASRDKYGIRPLILGKVKNQWMVASETHAFDKVGAKVVREIKRGEVIQISTKGIEVLRHGNKFSKHFCDFEWAYFSRPDTLLPINGKSSAPKFWMSINQFRENCGRELAKEHPIKGATFAVGVPDSGVPVTTGYANALGIPYRQIIVRDHYDPNGGQRLFMRDDQIKRIKKKVLGKLSLVPDSKIWKDAVVVVGDDSIVRGNVSMEITKAIFQMGAIEVHWIVGYPPVSAQCHLGVSIRTKGELIASRLNNNTKQIAKKIGATTVNYISPTSFVRARVGSKKMITPKDNRLIFLENGGCGGCVTGVYPIDRDGVYYKDKQ